MGLVNSQKGVCMAPSRKAEAKKCKTLLIAYGNTTRRDDGVAYHVVQRLCARLGLEPDALDAEEGMLDERLSILRLHQLAPELAETLARYDAVIFIDAHVGGQGWAPVEWRSIEPAYAPGLVSHHLKPAAVLALCDTLYGAHPQGYALSILGHDFDFGEDLSPATLALVDEAVERLERFLEGEPWLQGKEA